jgi:hypothetical protein
MKIKKVGEIGPIPYDWRKPTMERFMSRVWNPKAPFITKRWFGWGWSFNVYAIVHPIRWRRATSKTK